MPKITFYGGAGTVTGSKYLIEHNGRRILVDSGLFQGLADLRELNWQPPPFDPTTIDAVVLTHAHIDHTGYLPKLVKSGFAGPVITSKPTADLLRILLPDSARLQEEEADYRNRHQLTSHTPALPLYDEADAREALERIQTVTNDGKPNQLTDGITASFLVAGHIMGASLVLLELTNTKEVTDGYKTTRLLFSGDLGHYDQPILKDPVAPPNCDYVVCESTYGDRLHGDESPADQLARIINQAVERKGPILIPAFAVGRTQEVLYTIRELEDQHRIPVLPVIVDSPMAAQATQVYNRFHEEHDEEYASILAHKRHPLRTASMTTASSRDESKRLNHMHGTRIIISASGMITGGRVLHHALRILPDPNATVVFVGFQAAGTRGRLIQDGAREVKIMRNMVPVHCHIEKVEGFSAHADWQGILRWLDGLQSPPKRLFLTHGEVPASTALAERIRERFHWTVEIPTLGETFELA